MDINRSLREFDATEANLVKLERLWTEIEKLIPAGVSFSENPAYQEKCRVFRWILGEMPAIGDFVLENLLLSINDIGGMRVDALECELEAPLYGLKVEEEILAQGTALREYRFRYNQARKGLVLDTVNTIVDEVDSLLHTLVTLVDISQVNRLNDKVEVKEWELLKEKVIQLESLFGASMNRPSGWHAFQRHLGFGEHVDLRDIIEKDWPQIRGSVTDSLRGENDPTPVGVGNLNELTVSVPEGQVITKLN